MAMRKKLLTVMTGLVLAVTIVAQSGMTAMAAGTKDYLNSLNSGVAAILSPGTSNTTSAALLAGNTETEEEESNRVMANVSSALNIRSEANGDAEMVGKLYKDCGGVILERQDGWTKLQSGNVIGWANDEYLLFGEDAEELAASVGVSIAYMNDTTRVREDADAEAAVLGILPKGEMVEVIEVGEDGWVCFDYDGGEGYVLAEYVTLDFLIDVAESAEEIALREEQERLEREAQEAAKLKKSYSAYSADMDTTLLLAALIQCEAGGESYEGKLAVGAVVMNRVRSSAYPNSVSGVIYASGQFTPAMTGKLNTVYASGNINSDCMKAAEEALAGTSNVGDLTHFRRNDGRDGVVIGSHVFY